MKLPEYFIGLIIPLFILAVIIDSCSTSQLIADKSGVQLWGENCVRCHNAPSPLNFNDNHWEIIGSHMKIRANLTDEETKKIIEFLQSAN